MIWTDEVVEELKKMWDRGMTTGQIAKALHVTKNSIIGKVHRLCLTARPSPIKKMPAKDQRKNTGATNKNAIKPAKAGAKLEKKIEQTINETNINEVPEETNIPLVKLDNHTCRWPLGDPRDDDFCFCGKRVKTGQTYCEEHAGIAYVRSSKKI
ncbi:global cell cycle regulator GcrA-like protein [bacterium]|nr:global cell cycle regulator GcrA-like protein [bacterium]MBR2274126.1 global cell cycle regulator GcrA-like protein [Alphaproteobacteria bacterium]